MFRFKAKFNYQKCIIAFFAVFCFCACNNSSKDIPFPFQENEYEQIRTTTLKPLVKIPVTPKIVSFKHKLKEEKLRAPEVFDLNANEFQVNKGNAQSLKAPSVLKYFYSEISNCNPKKLLLSLGQKVIAKNPQSSDGAIKNIKFYSQDQGLIATIGHCMIYDNDGRLWIGTDGGLCMFDGHQWIIYTTKEGLCNNYVSCLMVTRDGRIFAGTDGGGMNVFDFKKKLIYQYTFAEGLSDNYVISLLEHPDGRIFIGTDGGGLNILDEEKKQITQIAVPGLNRHNHIKYLLLYRNSIYLGTNGDGVSKLDESNKQFLNYSVAQGLSHGAIHAMQYDTQGNFYVGTNGGGLNVLNFERNTVNYFSHETGLSSDKLTYLFLCKNNDLLMGTEDAGFMVFNYQSGNLKLYSEKEGLNNTDVISIRESEDGKVLVGTYGGGLNVLDNKYVDITHYTTKEGLKNNYVKCLAETNENEICIGTNGGGLNLFKNNHFEYYTTNQGLNNNDILFIRQSNDGRIYLGTDEGGVNIIDRKKQTITKLTVNEGLVSNNVYTLYFDKAGRLLVGSFGGGLSIVDFKNETIESYTTKEGLNHNYIRGILEADDGKLILTTDGGGINILDTKEKTVSYITTKNGFSNNVIFSIIKTKKGKLLVGTYGGGLNIIDLKTNSISKLTTKEGLPNDLVLSLKEDKNENVWVGTGKGLAKLILKNGNYKIEKVFGKDEGLKFVDFNTNCVALAESGDLWFGIGDVLTRFHQKIKSDSNVPQLHITEIDVAEKRVQWLDIKSILKQSYATFNGKPIETDTIWSTQQDTFFLTNKSIKTKDYFESNHISFTGTYGTYQIPKDLVLPFDKNHLTFHYSGIHIGADADQIRYRYILEGADDKWGPITEKMEADYRNIPPGDYVFKIAARSVNGNWSAPQEFKFTVLAPWYQTLWFKFLAIIFGIIIIWYFIKWREKSLKQYQEELQGLVNERTEEIVVQKQEIEAQQKEMIDSIIYAKRVQNAILPSENFIKQFLPNSFLLYKPKDIVAGDFYWMEVVDGQTFIAVADCTGHGVPGAMVSVVCSNALNRALNEFGIRDTGKILDKTREIVLDTFAKSGEDINDGMDISLLRINVNHTEHSKIKVQWAGANNSLKYIDGAELKEIKADKQPIGKTYVPKPFTSHFLELNKGSLLILMSDGYPDQFGGPKGKKFKHKQFNELLVQNAHLPIDELNYLMDDKFEDWRGYLEQVDDVCIIGIRL